MKTKNSYFSKTLVILMAIMMVFTMMPSMAFADVGGSTSTQVEWAGAANCNPENNNVKTNLQNPLNDYSTTYEKWKNEIVSTTGTTAVYAGQTAIVGDYIYISSGNGLEKINKETGETIATLAGVGSPSYSHDYMAYDETNGLLFLCDSIMKNAFSGTPSIKAIALDTFTKVGELDDLSLGTYHPIQCNENFLFSNGKVFKYTYKNGECTIETYDTIDGTYNWSSGCFVKASEGTYANKTVFYIASQSAVKAYCPETKEIIDTWTFTEEKIDETAIPAATYGAGVSYANNRIYFGYYNSKKPALTDGYMFSIKVNANGTFDKTGENSMIVKGSVQPTVCTPVISNGRVYVAGQSGAVSVYDAATLDTIYVAQANDLYNKKTGAYDGGITKIQSNPILYRDATAGKSYIYFQAYNVPGYIYLLEEADGATSGKLKRLATPSVGSPTDAAGAFAMEQIAIDNNGDIYCYNELGYLFCFSKTEVEMTSLTASIGDSSCDFTAPFDSQKQDYELVVGKDTKSVDFAFSVSEGATVKIDNTVVENSKYNFIPDFSTSEENTISIEISKGASTRIYTVKVRKISADTTISYSINGSSSSVPNTSTEVSGSQTIVNTASINKPCIWITAPKNGSIDCQKIDGTDTVSIGNASIPFAKKANFSKGVSKQDVIKVTATAEDGKTTQTYYFVLSNDGKYAPVEKKVYVTLSNKGEIVNGKGDEKPLLANVAITATDLNNDCVVDVNEALVATHNTYYEGAAQEGDTAAGYKSEVTQYGLSISKLWGNEEGSYGYYINNNQCWSLADTLNQDDYLKAYVYKDVQGYSDIYTFFEKNEYAAKMNEGVTLKLNQVGFDSEWKPVIRAYEGATIKVLNANSTKDYTTDKNGEVALKFVSSGIYKVIAVKADGSIVPSVCTVTVTNDSSVTPPSTETPKVKFTLKGDTIHNSDVDKKVHTLKSRNLSTWIYETSVDIKTGDSVGTVFKKVLDANNYTYRGLEQNYISEITKPGTTPLTLGEKDNGPNSGWMYTINGTHPLSALNDYKLSDGDVIVFHYTDDYTKEEGSEQWNGGGGGTTEEVKNVTSDTKTGTTTAPTEVKVGEKTNADGTKTKVAEVKVSADNQKEILKQAKAGKSKEIILNVSKSAVGDASKADVTLDKSFIDSIVKDTDAKLTIKTPFGDKTYTQDELKAMSQAAAGSTVTIAVEKAAEEPTDDTAANVAKAKSITADLKLVARSSKTAKKNVKAVLKSDAKVNASIKELKDLGYTVKYRFYRSTKKAASYKSAVTKKAATYTNTSGKKNTKYFYKVQVRVYDENGKLVAKTALKQCKYASRTWTK